MKFIVHGRSYMLHGEKSRGVEFLSRKKIKKCNPDNSSSFLLQIFSIALVAGGNHTSQVQDLLDTSTEGLPSLRSHGHQTHLLYGSNSISVMPYPYYQKTEIEKLVRELIQKMQLENFCICYKKDFLKLSIEDDAGFDQGRMSHT